MSQFWSKPLFWVGFHFVGLILTVVIYRLPALKKRALRTPKIVQRGFVIAFYLLPPLVLPLLHQSRLPWPIRTSSSSADSTGRESPPSWSGPTWTITRTASSPPVTRPAPTPSASRW